MKLDATHQAPVGVLLRGALILVLSSASFAGDLYYVGPDGGNWNDPANWSATSQGTGGAGVPANNDQAFVLAPQSSPTYGTGPVSVNFDATYATPGLSFLQLNGSFDGTNYLPATVNQSTGSLVAGQVQLGQAGGPFFGVYNQSGGSNTVGLSLYIETGSSYNLSGGSLSLANLDNNGTLSISNGAPTTSAAPLAAPAAWPSAAHRPAAATSPSMATPPSPTAPRSTAARLPSGWNHRRHGLPGHRRRR